MKKLNLLLMFIACMFASAQNEKLVKIEPDSIAIKLDIVESGYNTVFKDGVYNSRYSKKPKAESRAKELSLQYPNSDIEVRSPISRPKTHLEVYINKDRLLTNAVNTSEVGVVYKLLEALGEKDYKPYRVADLPTGELGDIHIVNDALDDTCEAVVQGGGNLEVKVIYIKNWIIF